MKAPLYWGVSSTHTGLKIYLLLGPPVRPKVKGEEAEQSASSFLSTVRIPLQNAHSTSVIQTKY